MTFSKKISRQALHYLPGLIILVFGMCALFYAMQIIEQQEVYKKTYQSLGHDVQDLQTKLFDLEEAFNTFSDKRDDVTFESLKKNLEEVDVYYSQIMKRRPNMLQQKHLDAYWNNLSSMNENITIIARGIKKGKVYQIEQMDKDGRVLDHESESIQGNIDDLLEKVSILQKDFFLTMDELLSSEEAIGASKNLYWDVIAIALSGFLLVMLNTFRVQELRKASEQNRQNLVLLQNRQIAIESSRDGLMIIDSSGMLTYVNEALLRMLSIDESKGKNLIGKIWHSIYSEEHLHKIKYEALPALEHQGYWRGKFILDKGDEKIYTDLSLTQLSDGGLIGSTMDITDEQKAREEKGRLEDQFYQAQKMEAIGRLTGGIAHDFNNILAAMNGYAEFLIEDLPKGSQERKFAQNILTAGRQARDLVDRLLTFSRRSVGSFQDVNILETIQETVVMLEASLSKTIELVTDIRFHDPIIRGNTTQIAQTIMNLCVNAKDAMEDEHGQLTIMVDLIAADDFIIPAVLRDALPDPHEASLMSFEDITETHTRLILGVLQRHKDYVLLRIQDTGIGISRATMEHIFEPFFTTKSVDKGTGLGLATVHGVIVGHQGMLVLDSILGQGTTFDLFFPYTGDEVRDRIDGHINEKAKTTTPTQFSGIQKEKILLVEDQDSVQDMMFNMLTRMGFDVDVADNGSDALDIIREKPEYFGLVITDHNMPRMTGLELVQQVHLDLPDLPFILFSGYSEIEIENIQLEHSAIKAVLRKPLTRDVLEGKIKQILQQSKQDKAA